MERGCFDYFRRIDSLGGMIEAIEAGFPQREIMDAAYAYQRAVDSKDKIVVGVNEFVEEDEAPLETLYIDESVEEGQKADLARLRRSRDGKAVTSSLAVLRQACADGRNVMPPLVEAVKTYATVGEISDVMREVFATYEEPAVF
jgi:methylmalonyl-CoA mutase N-terminal domain/subunit